MTQGPSEEKTRQFRFGPFELDAATGELRRNGIRLPVHGQPLQILELLLRSPRQLVSREQLRQALWPGGTFVEFNDSLNASVRRLRQALEDEADQPRFIETLPRRGYRFLGEVEVISRNDGTGAVAPQSSPARPKPVPRLRLFLLASAIILVAAVALLGWTLRSRAPKVQALVVLPF